MRLVLGTIALTIGISSQGVAQQWEIGAVGGYGWYRNSSLSNSTIFSPPASAEIGLPSRATIGVVVGETPFHHLGGEIRWLYQWGGPQIAANGVKTSMSGYSNLVTYDFMIYPTSSEAEFRPYLAGGAGVKAYTGTGFEFVGQLPTAGLGLLRPVTQAEGAISAGGGLKYRFAKHAQLRIDIRAYFTPTPDALIHPTHFSVIRGWLSEIVPTAGLSYVF
jgi:hypothetical protein